jgi:hypothetical protein
MQDRTRIQQIEQEQLIRCICNDPDQSAERNGTGGGL